MTTETTAEQTKPTRSITYQVYNDPGHGWVKVPHKDLATLGIADQISSYSYQRGAFAYLEEDCDYSLLVRAARAAGWKVSFCEHHTDKQSRIRNYDTYKKPPAPASPPANSEMKSRIAKVWTRADHMEGDGYIVGVIAQSGKLIVAVDGNLNLKTFEAIIAEAVAKGLSYGAMFVYCDSASLTGDGIDALKYADQTL